MAITSVKPGNVTTLPPAKTTDTKLTTQFNAAAKAGAPSPSSKVLPPFYTPREGNFGEKKNFASGAYNTRLYWKLNPNQQAGSNKVFINGSLSIDWGQGRGQSFVIDGNNSYIDKDGKVFYRVGFFSEGVYKTRYNLFNAIENKVYNALRAVYKNTEYTKTETGKISPVSQASASLSAALNAVGEENLENGKGLNGAGSRIKDVLDQQLKKTDTSDKAVRIRQAIALAMNASGVKTKLPKSKPQALEDRIHLGGVHITNYVAGIVHQIRQERGFGAQLTPREELILTGEIQDRFRGDGNLRLGVARAIAIQIAAPGALQTNGLTVEQYDAVTPLINAYLGGQQNVFRDYNATNPAMFQNVNLDELVAYLRDYNPIAISRLYQTVQRVAEFVNANQNLTANLDTAGTATARQTLALMGSQMGFFSHPLW